MHSPPSTPSTLNLTSKLLSLLKQCTSIESIKQVHSQMLIHSLQNHNQILSKLIDLNDFSYSSLLFSHIPIPNDFSYNVMIRGLTKKWHNFTLTLQFYHQMKLFGLKPNNFTYPFVLISCANLPSFYHGIRAHSSVLQRGLRSDPHVAHSLITMYARCGDSGGARDVFDEITERDVVSWNAMISGYLKMGCAAEAVVLFRRMRVAGFEPDEMTLVSVLAACADVGDLSMGKWIEGFVVEGGIEMNSFLGSALIDMYGKCGNLESARRVFDGMSKRELVIWNAMITGQITRTFHLQFYYDYASIHLQLIFHWFSQNGASDEAIKLFHGMIEEGVTPDKITLVGALSACASIGALDLGKWIDSYASQRGMNHDIFVGTSLMDMYAKCGGLDDALKIFEDLPQKNIVSWNTIISALAAHGRANDALSSIKRMVEEDKTVQPNDITFVGVLSACVHAGLVDEGYRWFNLMSSFGLTPKIEHYSCMVDLLARAGRLMEALEFIRKMPEEPDAITLGALLAACRNFGNMDVGEQVMHLLLDLEPSNSGNYVISSKIYAKSKKWDDSARMRRLMRERGVSKTPGCSWVEIENQVFEFHAGDLCLNSREIHRVFILLKEEMKNEGYRPMVDFL
ncbi:hypothetical protein Scep_027285 [Stephania cephalantha]|uniref:Uncharacterized protein n=1 Tax=Stephania cephalantha TaxID=152367 RepID=A0AAP0EAX4_9MAGN